jgi:hypothetical protein
MEFGACPVSLGLGDLSTRKRRSREAQKVEVYLLQSLARRGLSPHARRTMVRHFARDDRNEAHGSVSVLTIERQVVVRLNGLDRTVRPVSNPAGEGTLEDWELTACQGMGKR